MSIFFILKKRPDSTKQSSRRRCKEKIKKRLIDSFVYNENSTTEDLNMRAKKDYEEAMNIIKEYEDIIKTNKKNVILFCTPTR